MTSDQIAALYQQYLGRDPEAGIADQWANGGLSDQAITQAIANSPEAQQYQASQAPSGVPRYTPQGTGGPPTAPAPTPAPSNWFTTNAPPAPAATGSYGGSFVNPNNPLAQAGTTLQQPTGGNLSDPNYASRLVQYYATQPGANPSLRNDPNYWINKITSGALGSDPNYIVSKFMQPEGAPAGNPNTAPLPVSQYGGLGQTPSPYVAPTWQGGPAPAAPTLPNAPTLTPYTAPTQAQLEASPGYQSRLSAAQLGFDRSAAAQGSGLSGGSQQALAQYSQNFASNEYNNLVGQGLSINANNNNVAQTGFGNQFNLAQTGFGNAFQTYQANYGQFQDAAAMGLNAYNTNVNTQRNAANDYWGQLFQTYNTGAGAANNSYRPSNVP
jgi:hypothetical protein